MCFKFTTKSEKEPQNHSCVCWNWEAVFANILHAWGKSHSITFWTQNKAQKLPWVDLDLCQCYSWGVSLLIGESGLGLGRGFGLSGCHWQQARPLPWLDLPSFSSVSFPFAHLLLHSSNSLPHSRPLLYPTCSNGHSSLHGSIRWSPVVEARVFALALWCLCSKSICTFHQCKWPTALSHNSNKLKCIYHQTRRHTVLENWIAIYLLILCQCMNWIVCYNDSQTF